MKSFVLQIGIRPRKNGKFSARDAVFSPKIFTKCNDVVCRLENNEKS
jgi:hypothetical protein